MPGTDLLGTEVRRWHRWRWLAAGAVLVVVCALVRHGQGPTSVQAAKAPPRPKTNPADGASRTADQAQATASTTAAPPRAQGPQIVAMVNGSEITRDDLAKLCLWHFGKDVLESVVNKTLIAEHCSARNIVVTQAEIEAEIDRMAERFGLPRDQWLKLLSSERGISAGQYANDIVWPTVALRKLAESRLTVSRQELTEAYETQFGPAVKVRLIACTDAQKARKVHAEALAHPEQFGDLAKQFSDDVGSASAKGLIQPIRKHLGDPQLEQLAFSMQPGQISAIVQIANQFVFIKCEEHLPAENRPMDEQLERLLTEAIRDKKLRLAANDLFQELQSQARVEIVYNDPAKSQQMPGVAAIINDKRISVRELADECIERHGEALLDGAIQRRIVEQALKNMKVEVTEADVQAELAATAQIMGKVTPEGAPDIEGWLAQVKQETGAERDAYIYDTIWPTVALKKIVGDTIEVTEEDIHKGFEANYGPRVRCRAIICNNQRRAQEIWEMARKNPTAEYFGDLAEQYSIEASSRLLRGEVPPIQKWGGEPSLEQEAFSLQPGELSGIVQVADQFVILFCEGHTKPLEVDLEEVRPMLIEDLREKKLRIAMAERFDQLRSASQIDNYLAQTSHTPRNQTAGQPQRVSVAPRLAPVPQAEQGTTAAQPTRRTATPATATAPRRR